MNRTYRRGTVYWVELPMNPKSHIQGGSRPCVIVSNPNVDERSGVVTVCPLSTRIDTIPTHVTVNVKKTGQVLCEQITTIDIAMLGDYVGCVNDHEMQSIDRTLNEYLAYGNAGGVSDNALMSQLVSIESSLRKLNQMMEFLMWKEGPTK